MLHTRSYCSCAFNDLLSIAGVVGICQQGNPPAQVEGAHCCCEYTKASGEAFQPSSSHIHSGSLLVQDGCTSRVSVWARWREVGSGVG